MITPGEITQKKFDKGISGYKQEAVDSYLESVANEMQKLINDKKDLESKITMLTEKLDEYRNDEDSLRTALLSAQKLGDSVVKEAKTKADAILYDASVRSEKMVESAQKHIEKERQTLISLQKEVSSFRSKLMSIYKGHIEMISKLPTFGDVQQGMEQPVAPAADATIEISKEELERQKKRQEMQELAAEMEGRAPASKDIEEEEELVAEQQEELVELDAINDNDQIEDVLEDDTEPATNEEKSSRFGPMKFGDGYNIRG